MKAQLAWLSDESIMSVPGINGSIALRLFPDGTIIQVEQVIFTNRLCLTFPNTNDLCYDDIWCFEKTLDIIEILRTWNYPEEREPMGWHRHPPSDRRRVKGDPNMEYVGMRPVEWMDL